MRTSSHRSAPITPEELDAPPIFLASQTPSLQCTACLGKKFSLAIVRAEEGGRIGLVRCDLCRKVYPVEILSEVY